MGSRHIKTHQVSTPKDRPGEITVPVSKKMSLSPDGTGQVTVEFNFDDVPIPDRRYVADTASILFDKTDVKLLFAQKKLVGDDLRSLVVITISPDPIRRFLETCTAFLPELCVFIEKYKIERPSLLKLTKEPDQTVSMASNIMTAARAGREAALDFYHASAASMHALNTRGRLAIEPVLRVDLSVGLLVKTLEEAMSLLEQLPEAIT